MKTVSLYHRDQRSQFQFDPTTLGVEKNTVLGQARKAAETLTGAPLTGEALLAFEANVGRWMDKGFEGHFSLSKALETSHVSGTKTNLIDVRTVGHEVELGTAGLRKTGIGYGDKLATTTDKATRLDLASTGVVSTKTKWPIMALTADGVSDKMPGKAHIEIVFGPVDLADHKEIGRRGRVTQILERALGETAMYGKPPTERKPETLKEAVTRYNALLGRETDAKDLAKYKLSTSEDITLSVPTMPTPSVQTNIEIPLRKLGDVSDTSVLALFGGKETEDKQMFVAARAEASRIVDTLLRDTASDLHGGKYATDSIKLDKLRGTLTLALLYVGKADQFDKEHWPFLPKTGAGDIIRSALSVRDKLALFHHTSDPTRYDTFLDEIVTSGLAVNAARGRAVEFAGDLPQEMRELADGMFKPGSRDLRWGAEADCYGTLLDPKQQNWSTGTSTGKPLPVGMDYTQKLLTSQVPKIVVELRRSDNPTSSSFEKLATYSAMAPKVAKTPLAQQPTYTAMVEAARHGPARAPKTEL